MDSKEPYDLLTSKSSHNFIRFTEECVFLSIYVFEKSVRA